MIPTSPGPKRSPGKRHHGKNVAPPRKLRLWRGLRPRIRRAAVHIQRGGLLRALRAGGAEARLRRRASGRRRARRPRQPGRQRRDPTIPPPALGEHVNDCWPELVGPAERSLVHWLRRLVFRGAWLDQRVNEGELGVASTKRSAGSPTCSPTRGRQRRADRARARALLGPRRLPPLARSAASSGARAGLRRSRAAPSSPTSSSARSVPLAARSRGGPPAPASAGSSAITVVSPPNGRVAVASIVSEPPSRRLRAAASALRAACGCRPSRRVDQHERVPAARGGARGGLDRALDRLALSVGRGGEAERRPPAPPGPRPTRRSPRAARRASTSVTSRPSRPASAPSRRRRISVLPARAGADDHHARAAAEAASATRSPRSVGVARRRAPGARSDRRPDAPRSGRPRTPRRRGRR